MLEKHQTGVNKSSPCEHCTILSKAREHLQIRVAVPRVLAARPADTNRRLVIPMSTCFIDKETSPEEGTVSAF